jgi:adenylate cyclase
MTGERVERRLAAILAADVAGYSRLIGVEEEGTLARLRAIRLELVEPKIAEHRGRIVKTTGDGLLIEFFSVVDALRCAVEVQKAMRDNNSGIRSSERIEFRIGIHQGDIVVEDSDIFGDGVNIAARLEHIAEPGGICVSARVQEDAVGRLDVDFVDIGAPDLKNIARPVKVYRVELGDGAATGLVAICASPDAIFGSHSRGASAMSSHADRYADIAVRQLGAMSRHPCRPTQPRTPPGITSIRSGRNSGGLRQRPSTSIRFEPLPPSI